MREFSVLIIEDNPQHRRILQKGLSDEFETETAEGGTEAMEKLKDGQEYDAVTLDLMMPAGNGVSFLKKAVEQELLRPGQVLVISHLDNPKTVVPFMNFGVFRFHAKPWNTQALIDDIHAICRGESPGTDELVVPAFPTE